jgi:release factor glutamine methyltransferase
VNLKETLASARAVLAGNHIEDASLESEVLLRHVLGISRPQLYSELDREIDLARQEVLRSLVERRLGGEPSAYITGHREFYGLDFYVDRRVLIPRPESELLVEKAVCLARDHPVSIIADIGTGCGALAISLALSLPETRIYATDISAPALEVARLNCRRHGTLDRVRLLHGDMLDPLPEAVDMIIANLPYVSKPELPRTGPLSFEPALALNGGPQGVQKLARLCHQAGGRLRPGGHLLLEIGQGQSAAVSAILHKVFPRAQIEVSRDLGGIERVVGLCLTSGCL